MHNVNIFPSHKREIFRKEVYQELTQNILPFWINHARDLNTGGFYGSLLQTHDSEGNIVIYGDELEPRSIVMTARHLWAYSASYNFYYDSTYLDMAHYAWKAITENYIDASFGGVFWSTYSDGSPCVTKKQMYGQAFALYGCAEYALALLKSPDMHDKKKAKTSLDLALSIYSLLEAHARDFENGGYVEARAQDWSITNDLKLSEKDIDCEKSMNTNLHVMEAYTTLLRALRIFDKTEYISQVEESLHALIEVTVQKIVQLNMHLALYFDNQWNPIGNSISYGHDIECSWLLWEALEELGNENLVARYKEIVVTIAQVSLEEGFDFKSGSMDNEFHNGIKDTTKVWWIQAETLVGFYNAWQLTNNQDFLQACFDQWEWIKQFQRDSVGGDWFAELDASGIPILTEPKGGNWKTAYHNARACIELLNRST